ncbi:four helix bundle protein [Chryseobacterium sp. Leaf180]|uniref:four helix bundle protein n=1 Tax=Chryseobacterium sp. Leaf180 TaxID=1736289 RepID=UPI0006F9101E|nr:four helix bundle protein [Chryseobacterium sp. Leaf180]KQR94420.1 four helix bundle protein [Chryseobacterium sp. Leaf180]
MRDNIVKQKSFLFAVNIVNLYKFLITEKKEYVMSKQMLRSGTSVGAMIREAEYAESKNDFKHKMAIAQKEINEALYWIELLKATDYLDDKLFTIIHTDAVEIIKLVTAILKSAKFNSP